MGCSFSGSLIYIFTFFNPMVRTLLIFLFIVFLNAAQSQEYLWDTLVFSTADSLEMVDSPSWSPDGSRLVFSAQLNNQRDLFIYQMDTDSLYNITNSGIDEFHPVWHPDGKQIVFSKRLGTGMFLYTIELSSGIQSKLFSRDIDCSQASFSTKNGLVCFIGVDEINDTKQVFTYDFIYDNLNQLTHHTNNCNSPCFSPNGKHILYEYVTDESHTVLRMINWYGKHELSLDSLNSHSPSWEPNSWRFNFIANSDSGNADVYSVRYNGISKLKLTHNEFYETDYSISPNEKHAVFILKNNKQQQMFVVDVKR